MDNIKTIHIIVSGRVQGVGYRWFAREAARRFRITGTVENLDTGDVELFAQASPEQLDMFLEKLEKGPSFGLVNNLAVTDSEDSREYNDFSILLPR